MGCLVYFDDRVNDCIVGWFAADPAPPSVADVSQVMQVSLGNIGLGHVSRTIVRPDVDAIFPHLGTEPKGFTAPLCALFAFADLCGMAGEDGVRLEIGDRTFRSSDIDASLRSARGLKTFRCSLSNFSVIHAADIWFANRSMLRVRLNAAGPDVSLRVYQPRPARHSSVTIDMVSEVRRYGGEDQIVDIEVANPFLPLLLTAFDSDDSLLAVDLLPFPSLCRGGAHFAELSTLGTSGDPIADLRIVGDGLLAEYFDRQAGKDCITDLRVDVRTATGAERLFDRYSLDWLVGFLGLRIELANSDVRRALDLGDPAAIDYLEGCVRQAGLEVLLRDGGGSLSITADAMPTISALLSRRLWSNSADAAAEQATSSFIVEGIKPGAPCWLLRPPADQFGLADLQPSGSKFCFPVVSAPAECSLDPLASSLPTAIATVPLRSSDPMALLYPFAPDTAHPLLAASGEEAPGLSVFIVLREQTSAFAALLTSLREQAFVSPVEILVYGGGLRPAFLRQVKDSLDAAFPGRHAIIEADHPLEPAAAYNALAERATHDLFLVVDPAVVLHDRRTLAVLARISACDTVGCASCSVLARSKLDGVTITKSTGYLPGRLDFALPGAEVMQLDLSSLLRPATLPVVATTFEIAMIKKAVWSKVRGLNASRYPRTRHDVDFGIRVIEQGWVNAVTTTVSVFSETSPQIGSYDIHAPFLSEIEQLTKAFAKSTIARRV